MTKRLQWLIVLIAMATTVSWAAINHFEEKRAIELNGIRLCIPREYASHQTPFWLKLIENELDNSSDSFLFYIQSETLREKIPAYKPDTNIIGGERRFTDRGVIVANVSAITGQSGAQQRLIELLQAGDAQFEESEWLGLFKVPHYESQVVWSLVRSKTLPSSIDTRSLHNWIAAYCGANGVDERYTCHIQRIIGNLSYNVSIPDLNMENMGRIEKLIEELLTSWKMECENKA